MFNLFKSAIGSIPRSVAILLVCALLGVIVDAMLFQYVMTSITQTSESIVNERVVTDRLDEAKDLLVDAETGARGYLLTGEQGFLAPYEAATRRVNTILTDLNPPAVDDVQVTEFIRLARAMLDSLSNSIGSYHAGDRDSAVDIAAGDASAQSMDSIRGLVQARKDQLNQRVDVVRTNRDRNIRLALIANVAIAVLAGGILIFFGVALATHLYTQRRVELDTQNSNVELQRKVAQSNRNVMNLVQEKRAELAERRQTEEMLRASEEKFKLLVAGVKDYAIYMLDPEGHITSWNAGAERIKGYQESEVIGKHFSIFYTDEDRAAGVPQKALQRAREAGVYEAEAVRVRKGGERFFASVVIDPLRDANGHLIGYAKITRDITEKHQQQQALDEANMTLAHSQRMEALGQLSGGIAHDFNNLLHVIRNASEVLDHHLPAADSAAKATVDMIKRSVDRAASLTKRLLTFSRRQHLEPRTIFLDDLVKNMDGLLRPALGEGIHMKIISGETHAPIWADPNQLEISILNLAVNARDAMPEGGILTIETRDAYLDQDYAAAHDGVKAGHYGLIVVSDTGTGMTEEVLAKAFDPFFTTKAIGQGTGLGLAQVYGFVKQSGGHINIRSELNKGTTIELYLPQVESSSAIQPEHRVSTESRTPHETILLVEDEEDVRTFTATILYELGYRVFTASDASGGLAILEREQNIDLLFTDVVLPGRINGRQLADEALKLRPELKVLYTTGYARDAFQDDLVDLKIEMIAKPFSQASLAAKIREVLERTPAYAADS